MNTELVHVSQVPSSPSEDGTAQIPEIATMASRTIRKGILSRIGPLSKDCQLYITRSNAVKHCKNANLFSWYIYRGRQKRGPAMRVIDQQTMNLLFEVTDEIPVDREAIQVPLVMEGEGKVVKTSRGKFEITLPDTGDLGPFLSSLPDRLRELGAAAE